MLYHNGIYYSEFASLSPEQQEAVVLAYFSKESDSFLGNIMYAGHSHTLHAGRTEEELLVRVLTECKPCSTFDSLEQLKWNIQENIKAYIPEILEWLADPDKPLRQQLSVPVLATGSENWTSCRGIDTNFNVVSTPDATLIIERNYATIGYAGNFFFSVKTFYLDMESPEAQLTGENLSDKAKLFYNYGLPASSKAPQLNFTQKTFWTFKMLGLEPKLRHLDDEKTGVVVPFAIGDKEFSINFNESTKDLPYTPASIITGTTAEGKPHYTPLHKVKTLDEATRGAAENFINVVREAFNMSVANEPIEKTLFVCNLDSFVSHPTLPINIDPHRKDTSINKTNRDEENITV